VCYVRAYVEIETKRALIDAAQAEGTSISALVRQALLLWFSRRD
jgi:hypothetical protein